MLRETDETGRAVGELERGLDESFGGLRVPRRMRMMATGQIRKLREMLDRTRLNQIRDMREDQKEDAMIVAMSAYAKLAGPEARPDLERLARDPSLRVQAAAKEALSRLR